MSVSKAAIIKRWNALGNKMDWRDDCFKKMVIDFYFENGARKGYLIRMLCLPKETLHTLFYNDDFGKRYFEEKRKAYTVKQTVSVGANTEVMNAVYGEPKKTLPLQDKTDDLKHKILDDVKQTKSAKKTAEKFNISLSTVYRYIDKYMTAEEKSMVIGKMRSKRMFFDKKLIMEIIDYYLDSDDSFDKVCEDLGMSKYSLCYCLYNNSIGKEYYAKRKLDLYKRNKNALNTSNITTVHLNQIMTKKFTEPEVAEEMVNNTNATETKANESTETKAVEDIKVPENSAASNEIESKDIINAALKHFSETKDIIDTTQKFNITEETLENWIMLYLPRDKIADLGFKTLNDFADEFDKDFDISYACDLFFYYNKGMPLSQICEKFNISVEKAKHHITRYSFESKLYHLGFIDGKNSNTMKYFVC